MASDIFIKIDDIQGETADKAHPNEIQVLSWSWAMSQSGTSHSGTGSGAGKVQVQDLQFVKHVDKSSPNLIKMCCSGKHFQKADIVMRKAGGSALEYIKLTLKDGLIASVTMGGSHGEELLTETVTLNFASFSYVYLPQDAKGAGKGANTANWNIAKNSES